MFNNLFFYPFVDGIVRYNASVRPLIFDVVVMRVVVKGDVFEFIGHRLTNNWMVFYESHQDWFYFVAMYTTHMPHINVMKKLRWERIQMCELFFRNICLKLGDWKIQGWENGVAWGREDVLVRWYFYYWYSGDMLRLISQFDPAWTWCGDDNALISCPGKVSCHKGSFYYA